MHMRGYVWDICSWNRVQEGGVGYGKLEGMIAGNMEVPDSSKVVLSFPLYFLANLNLYLYLYLYRFLVKFVHLCGKE